MNSWSEAIRHRHSRPERRGVSPDESGRLARLVHLAAEMSEANRALLRAAGYRTPSDLLDVDVPDLLLQATSDVARRHLIAAALSAELEPDLAREVQQRCIWTHGRKLSDLIDAVQALDQAAAEAMAGKPQSWPRSTLGPIEAVFKQWEDKGRASIRN